MNTSSRLAACLLTAALAVAGAHASTCPALLQHSANRLVDDKPQALCQYSGKVLLVVNTASHCGFTPQYEGLEALHARYAERGLVVMGFPSNDFGAQEPGKAEDIAKTCFNVYGVRFPMFAKVGIKGAQPHPFYAQLIRVSGQAPRWNFHKYLVDRRGQVIGSFDGQVPPTDARITAAIDRALTAR